MTLDTNISSGHIIDTTSSIPSSATTRSIKTKPCHEPTSGSQSTKTYVESSWNENEKIKLNALKKIHQTSAPKDPFSSDWKQIAKAMNRRPGDCLRQHCSFNKFTWTREEDLKLLTMMEAEASLEDMVRSLYPCGDNQTNRVANRMQLLKRNQLNTLKLYEGMVTDDEDSDTGDDTDDLIHTLGGLQLSDDADIAFTKAHQQALDERARQNERIRTINKKWAIKCASDMAGRDYGIYHTYYKQDEQRKSAIVNGKREPTVENMLPKVIDGYARSNGVCCYCGRVIFFSELKAVDPTTAASPDHFDPRMMAFNSDTYLHFTCRQCNYAKSNATHVVFKTYLHQIKTFHAKVDKLFTDYIPLDDTNRLQAWVTWKVFKASRWKKRSTTSVTDNMIRDLQIISKSPDQEIPEDAAMDDDDRLFMAMVDMMGLRDPMTGAIGVYDSTWQRSNRFILTNWTWGKNNMVITGFDVAPFEDLGVQIIMKFTKDTQAEFGQAANFAGWLEAIQQVDITL